MDEASGNIQICVEHKQCLQREIVVNVSLETVVTGMVLASTDMCNNLQH